MDDKYIRNLLQIVTCAILLIVLSGCRKTIIGMKYPVYTQSYFPRWLPDEAATFGYHKTYSITHGVVSYYRNCVTKFDKTFGINRESDTIYIVDESHVFGERVRQDTCWVFNNAHSIMFCKSKDKRKYETNIYSTSPLPELSDKNRYDYLKDLFHVITSWNIDNIFYSLKKTYYHREIPEVRKNNLVYYSAWRLIVRNGEVVESDKVRFRDGANWESKPERVPPLYFLYKSHGPLYFGE